MQSHFLGILYITSEKNYNDNQPFYHQGLVVTIHSISFTFLVEEEHSMECTPAKSFQ